MTYNESVIDRFWSKINCKGDDDCWNWQGGKHSFGYGVLGRGRRGEGLVRANRLAWELTYGPIPDGMCVLHKCDNPSCVNPKHLFLGTRADNNLDAKQKGRTQPPPIKRGSNNCRAKLTEVQVAELRARYMAGLPPKRKGRRAFTEQLAAEFGIDRSQVNNIVARRQWR